MPDSAATLKKLLEKQKVSLAMEQVDQMVRLMDELLRWNRKHNLTAITKPLDVIEKHLLDSLSLLPYMPPAGRLLDIGSGAGFPCLPLKIACPALEVVSVDSIAKKIGFQRHIARTLNLSGFTAIHGRIEECRQHPAFSGGFDLVTARALTHLSQLVLWAEAHIRPAGSLIAMKGPEGPQEWQECRGELEAAGWYLQLKRLSLPLSKADRSLLVLSRHLAR